jgi:hypothetical protein
MKMPKRETRIRILKTMKVIDIILLLAGLFLAMLGVSMMDSASLIYPLGILAISVACIGGSFGLAYLLSV